MGNKKIIMVLVTSFCWIVPFCFAQEIKPETLEFIVEGRVVAESHQGQSWLVLYGKDGRTYLLYGKLLDKINTLRQQLGEKNLFALKGFNNRKGKVECRNKQVLNEEGQLFPESTCLRFRGYEVTEILDVTISDEIIPPPEHDLEEEKLAKERLQKGIPMPEFLAERRGRLRSVNIKGPIKSFEIEFKDKNGQLITESFFLSDQTKVYKKTPTIDGVVVGIDGLKDGQFITVVYLKKDNKNIAQFITITNE
ncbi:MAG: hypothetical protein N2606_03790 [Candidatus Omnitrophica bacterium]|nr:hypothetical protein [Candidatus Omnitrophota bacterium]